MTTSKDKPAALLDSEWPKTDSEFVASNPADGWYWLVTVRGCSSAPVHVARGVVQFGPQSVQARVLVGATWLGPVQPHDVRTAEQERTDVVAWLLRRCAMLDEEACPGPDGYPAAVASATVRALVSELVADRHVGCAEVKP